MRIPEYDDGYESAYWFERADEDGPDDGEPEDDDPFDLEADAPEDTDSLQNSNYEGWKAFSGNGGEY